MVKASTPIFVLLWAYLFGIERITVALITVVIIIAAGEFLTVLGEVSFDRIGFVLCLSASFLSGARWTLVQLKLRSLDPPLKTTIATMRLLSPSMFFSLLFLSLIIEEPWNRLAGDQFDQISKVIGLGLIGAFFAIAMVLCEFYLIMQSTAVVLMIGGVIKEMVTIFVGVFYFHDQLNAVNLAGCFVVFLGVLLFKIVHYRDAQEVVVSDILLESERPISRCDDDDELEDYADGDNECGDEEMLEQTKNNGNYKKVSSGSDIAEESYCNDLDGFLGQLPGKQRLELRRSPSNHGNGFRDNLRGQLNTLETKPSYESRSP
jgi:solute carrier family 35 protein C2